MDRMSQTRVRRKLSRSQIVEILERNVTLYKNNDDFVHYLVELGLYLLEYEYDWSERAGSQPPPHIRKRGEGEAEAAAVQDEEPLKPAGEAKPVAENKSVEGKLISPAIHVSSPHVSVKRKCPFCGTEVGDALVCHKCKNLTR